MNRIKFSKSYKNKTNNFNLVKIYYFLRYKLVDFYRTVDYILFKKKEFLKLNVSKFPKNIQIEPSTECNASCITCPQKSITRKVPMKLENIKKIIDQCAGHDIEEIYPVNYNELFLYPHALEILKYIKLKLPKARVVLYTNASVLTQKIADILIKEQLVYSLNFSLDAFNKKTYETVRGLNYENTIKNTTYFLKKNKEAGNSIKAAVTFTITDVNQKEIKPFKKFWKKYTSNIYFSADDGRKSNNPYINRPTRVPCSNIFKTTTILCNGDVVPCCMDPHGSYVIGNIHKNSIAEIWQSKKYKLIRKIHLTGNRYKMYLCKNCPMI